MYVEPGSHIRLLKDVPLDTSYNHTILFTSKATQASYFAGLTKHNLTNQSYQRVERGYMRVDLSADACYDCNYVMFQNSSFGSKWFYGFITGVEYVNNRTTEISFEIDVIQTWITDFSLERCMIERQHTTSDDLFEHRVPEPIPLGDCSYSSVSRLPVGSNWDLDYLVFSGYSLGEGTKKIGASAVNGSLYGCYIYYAKNEAELNDIVEGLQDIADESVYAIQSIPTLFAEKLTTSAKRVVNSSYATKVKGTIAFDHNLIGDYTPRNKKCFCFPYYGLYISNQNGSNDVLDFADFSNPKNISYTIYGDVCLNNSPILHLDGYKGLGGRHDYDIQCSQSPQAQYNSNNFNAYSQAQVEAKFSAIMGGGLQVANGVSGLASDQPSKAVSSGLGAGLTAVNYLAQSWSMEATQQNTPPNIHNLGGNSELTANMGGQAPIMGIRHMNVGLIKRLDEFFDIFGYQVNHLGVPQRSSRPHWNYVKTNGCVVTGSVPANDMNKICQIHDNGITYWRNGSEVGDYTLNNAP